MDENEDYYKQYLSEVDILRTKNKKAAVDRLRLSLVRLKVLEPKKLERNTIEIVLIVSIAFIILGLGFFSENTEYFFGFVFFIAGVCVGLFVPVFGLIFLFSHGVTGLSFMVLKDLKEILSSPIMTDNPTNLRLYLGIAIASLIFGIILTIVYNLANTVVMIKKVKGIPYLKVLIMILFLLGIALIVLYPYLYKYVI